VQGVTAISRDESDGESVSVATARRTVGMP
jgi:hypothetical protein